MWMNRFMHALPMVTVLSVSLGLSVGVWRASLEAKAHASLQARMRSVQVVPPRGLPPLKQESVDLAMALYGVDKGRHVVGPALDGELEDRGLTTGGTLALRKTVTLGPSAFTSWAVLGSTLGHEIEVHARQSFLAVVLRDRFAEVQLSARRRIGVYVPAAMPSAREGFENDGTWRAEREAYLYELSNARRYGLSEPETRSIRYVMNYYYPEAGVGADGGDSSAGATSAKGGGNAAGAEAGLEENRDGSRDGLTPSAR